MLFTILTIEIEEEKMEEGNEEHREHYVNELVITDNSSSNDISKVESIRKSKEKYSEYNICGKKFDLKSMVQHKRNLYST